MFELDEVKEHFEKLDSKARHDYQTITMQDLDLIDWLIEQAEKVEQLQKENQWLYGKLNIISDAIEKARKEVPKF